MGHFSNQIGTDMEKIEKSQDRINKIINYLMRDTEFKNKFETWDSAYINLTYLGFSHIEIIDRIGIKTKNKPEANK